eukprot:1901358-Ditylum_brightwellii.AAC.1
MKNVNKLAQCLVAKKPRISTLAGPQFFINKKKVKKRRLPNTAMQQPINSSPQSARPQSDTSTASEESDDESTSPSQYKESPQKSKSTPQQKNKPPQKTQQQKNPPPPRKGVKRKLHSSPTLNNKRAKK